MTWMNTFVKIELRTHVSGSPEHAEKTIETHRTETPVNSFFFLQCPTSAAKARNSKSMCSALTTAVTINRIGFVLREHG